MGHGLSLRNFALAREFVGRTSQVGYSSGHSYAFPPPQAMLDQAPIALKPQ
jgi:hypothetical protein